MFQQCFSLLYQLKHIISNPFYEQPDGTAGKLVEIFIKRSLPDLTVPYLAL